MFAPEEHDIVKPSTSDSHSDSDKESDAEVLI